ncbi:MAG: phosphocarrier protein HPr [Spirochaetes bacterium RIFOXYC1_FULL_54_7]|nr:MAG: phosphocarrier protein HPr [Spirochaetes bacterium RIFOXYC1_FULL_54_7]
MVEIQTIIKNRAGIHARPAAMIVQTAGKFKSRIFLQNGDDRINAKSIMGIITLGAGFESRIRIIAEGDDEADAAAAIERLFVNRFEEE